MIFIESELTLTAGPGDLIDDFVPEAIQFAQSHYIKKCILHFNSWRYSYKQIDSNKTPGEIINVYMKYIN